LETPKVITAALDNTIVLWDLGKQEQGGNDKGKRKIEQISRT